MIVYEARGALFRTRSEAQRAIDGTAPDTGRYTGGFDKTIREIVVHDTAEAWNYYTCGHNRSSWSPR